MLTELVSNWAVHVLDTTGYLGAGALMALESMVVPIPSEAVMPFVGFLVADGKWHLLPAILVTSSGSLFGSYLSYLAGRYGGKPVVMRIGKYLLLRPHDLELTERFFHRRQGGWTVFVSRFIPVIRHLISIPAGTGRMPLGRFLLSTAAGATLWNSLLLTLGMKLREHWMLVLKYSHLVDLAMLGMVVVALGWFIYNRKQYL